MDTHRKNNIVHHSPSSGRICNENNKIQDVPGPIRYFENSFSYSKLSEDLQIDSRTLNHFFSILRDTNSDLNLRNILDKFLNACITFFQADRGAILFHNNNGEFELKAARDNKNKNLLSFPISKTITQIIINKKNSLFFPDFFEDDSLSSTPNKIDSDRHAILCAPLNKNTYEKNTDNYSTDINELTGLIYLEKKDNTGTTNFNESKLIFLQVLADQAAAAIDNALVNEKQKKSIEHLEDRINLRNIELTDSKRQINLNRKKISDLKQKLKNSVKDGAKKTRDPKKNILNENHKDEFTNITTETLHNVKNILNSIKVSSDLVGKLLIGKAYTSFCQANELLRKNMDCLEEFICDNPRGKKLMRYYLKLEDLFRDEFNKSNKQIDRLRENVSIINDIISTQQWYSKGTILEEISLSKIIDDVLIIQSSILNNFKIKVIKGYSDLPVISIHKTKFMHVLINLIKNAKEAMIETPVENRILRLEYEENENENIVQLKISDNGCGIPGKNIKHLFSYGFTTKKDGNGYGLHSCRVYMKEMGGDITAFSEGEAKGSTFTIELHRSGKK